LVPALFLPVLRRLVLVEEVLQLLPRLVLLLLVKLLEEEEQQKLLLGHRQLPWVEQADLELEILEIFLVLLLPVGLVVEENGKLETFGPSLVGPRQLQWVEQADLELEILELLLVGPRQLLLLKQNSPVVEIG